MLPYTLTYITNEDIFNEINLSVRHQLTSFKYATAQIMCATQAAHMTGTHFMSNKVSVYVTGSDISSKLWLRVCLLNYTTETPGFVITCPTILPREKKYVFDARLRPY